MEITEMRRPVKIEEMTPKQRLDLIGQCIESVDNRCMAADGDVTNTLEEMSQEEISRVYALAKGDSQFLKEPSTGV